MFRRSLKIKGSVISLAGISFFDLMIIATVTY
jgi:hypothetical protein